jgi:DNA repair exonuclease SbcCD ATPase subunit
MGRERGAGQAAPTLPARVRQPERERDLPTRDQINLRLLLELRRRLKLTAERELAVGAERVRGLRNEVRRAEAELRLCLRRLNTRARELAQAAVQVGGAQERASETCTRLSSLVQENDDLDQQLKEAQQDAAQVQLSVHGGDHNCSSTLDSFVLATGALMRQLTHASRDQSQLRSRAHDLAEESHALATRADSLQACFRMAQHVMTEICEKVTHGLNGSSVTPGGTGGALFTEGGAAPLPEGAKAGQDDGESTARE